MGVDEYRDREGDAEERTGVGQGEADQDASGAASSYRDTEGDAEARTGPGSDPDGVDDDFTDSASLGSDTASG